MRHLKRTPRAWLLRGVALGAAAVLAALGVPLREAAGQESAASDASLAAAFAEFARACEADAGRLWGISLCGPILVADTEAGRVVANRSAPGAALEPQSDGSFVGSLPADLPRANTAVEWAGVEWAMVLAPLPEDPMDRVDLLVHETFHRVQDDLGLTAQEHANDHLEGRDGRLWLRLELRALARALASDSAAGREAARDALVFRARRHALDPNAAVGETALEIQEGLAAYTGAILASSWDGAAARAMASLAHAESHDSFARSFAYATGPALGLLADRYAPGWRGEIRGARDVARLLAGGLGFDPTGSATDEIEARAREYGFAEVAAAEGARRAEVERRLVDYRARLVDGPVLILPLREMRMRFDPNAVTPLGATGTVYPTITLYDRWGTLTVENSGALIAPDFTRAVVPRAAGSGCAAAGAGWRLELAEGWTLEPAERPGDCRAAVATAAGSTS